MFQALYKKIYCDFHIYNPGVFSLVSHWKLGPRRPETKYFMGKESTCHDPERKPRNQHEMSTSHGFHDVQKKMSLQNPRTSLSILKHPTKQKSHYPPYVSRILLNIPGIPPSFFLQEKQTTPWCWWNTPPPTPSPTAPICISINASPPMDRTRLPRMTAKPQTSSKCPMRRQPKKNNTLW